MSGENNTFLYDQMTVERINEEYGIGQQTVRLMFKDEKCPVQTYGKKHFVIRKDLLKYWEERHDYLVDRY